MISPPLPAIKVRERAIRTFANNTLLSNLPPKSVLKRRKNDEKVRNNISEHGAPSSSIERLPRPFSIHEERPQEGNTEHLVA